MISTLWIEVPAAALVPAILLEAIVLAIMLKRGPARALIISLRTNLWSALIVLALLIIVELLLVSLDESRRMHVFTLITASVLSISVIALPPGFMVAWWVKRSIIARLAPGVHRHEVLQATGVAHTLSTCAMAAAAAALLTIWPAHSSWQIRTRVGNGLNTAVGARNAVSLFWEETGRLPASMADLPESIPTSAHDVVTVEATGRVTLSLSAPKMRELDGKRIIFTPIVPHTMQEPLHWQCSSPDIEWKYLPAECRSYPDFGHS